MFTDDSNLQPHPETLPPQDINFFDFLRTEFPDLEMNIPLQKLIVQVEMIFQEMV